MQAVNNYIIVQKIKQGTTTDGGLILKKDVEEEKKQKKAKGIKDGKHIKGKNDEDVEKKEKPVT